MTVSTHSLKLDNLKKCLDRLLDNFGTNQTTMQRMMQQVIVQTRTCPISLERATQNAKQFTDHWRLLWYKHIRLLFTPKWRALTHKAVDARYKKCQEALQEWVVLNYTLIRQAKTPSTHPQHTPNTPPNLTQL